MLIRPPFTSLSPRPCPPAYSEPYRSNPNPKSSSNDRASISSSRSSNNSRSSFDIAASSSRATAETRTASSGSRSFRNGALLDRLLLQEEELKEVSFASGEPCNPEFSATDLRLGGLDNILHSYNEKFVIRCYEVGMNRTASIETVANLLQEVACNHAQSVGFSTDGFATTPSMRKRRLIWVTTRMHIEVDEYPVWGDLVQVETWCQGEGKAGTRRDWLVSNVATGKVIGRATSTWVMMNQDSRRLSRITDDVREEYTQYCPTIPRYAFPEENSCSLRKIPKLQDPAHHVRSGLMPRRGDLDMNQHVNNVAYIGWILESMPQDILDTHQLHRITLDYRRECKHSDVVDSVASLETRYNEHSKGEYLQAPAYGNGAAINGSAQSSKKATAEACSEFLHLVRLAGSEIEINRGRTVWKTKSERRQQ